MHSQDFYQFFDGKLNVSNIMYNFLSLKVHFSKKREKGIEFSSPSCVLYSKAFKLFAWNGKIPLAVIKFV